MPRNLPPVREFLEDCLVLDPVRGPGFDLLNEIGQADGGMEAGEYVNVIIHAVDAIKVALAVSDDARDVTKEVFAAIRVGAGIRSFVENTMW
jgi:hypothetical protein